MSTDRTPHIPPEGEESWESLAEGLFGIEFRVADDAQGSIDVDQLLEDEPDEAPAADEEGGAEDFDVALADFEQAERSEPSTTTDDPEEVPSDFDTELDAEPVAEGSDDAFGERADDGFWDALDSWDWGDEPTEKPAGEARGRGRSPRRERSPEAPARELPQSEPAATHPEFVSRDAFLEDDDFSAGLTDEDFEFLDEEERAAEPQVASDLGRGGEPPASAVESLERVGESSRRRRRRRRRRPREERPAAVAADSDEGLESAEEFGEIQRDEFESADEFEPAAGTVAEQAGEEEDDFAAGLIESSRPSAVSDEQRSGRGRRRSRRHGEPRERAPLGTVPPAPAAADLRVDEAEDEAVETESPTMSPAELYRNVPTWEEAISYLLKGRAGEVRDSGRPGGEDRARGDSGEASRGSGRRGRSRRR